ncbi:hypothetical protein BCR32DRAFT_182287, partial [Anaeromyces robustus]
RYQNEYDEIEALGKGGFGQVYKARNRLDGQLYAIKKIKLQNEDLRIVREVKTFARISNHPNIVRYHASWIEKQNNLRLFLIIQMELCSGETLETWIRKRNQLTEKKEIHIDRKVIFKIFKQIVQAIAHVHWNGCIHRDVKPANVFLQDDNHILLGDFGLAKDVDFDFNKNKYGETEVNSIAPNLTSGVGTYIYASPEQLASSQGYDNKTDIYSLGILLFELLWPFKTGMERIKTLTNIRNGKFPDNFVEKWPLELPFLKSLLNPDPALRPTAQEILDS